MNIVPFRTNGDLILVPTRLTGRSPSQVIALMVLDTGANRSFVSWDVFIRLGYDPAATHPRVRITTVSSIEYAPLIPVARIKALGIEQPEFPMLCYTPPPTTTVDGVLGLDFFRGRRLTIDFRGGLVSVD